MVALGLAKPPLDSGHHVEAYRSGLVDVDRLGAGQQEDGLALLVLAPRPDDVVHLDLVSHVIDVLDLMAVEGDLSVPQALFLGYVRDVEEQTKSVVIFEAIVYVALCKGDKKKFALVFGSTKKKVSKVSRQMSAAWLVDSKTNLKITNQT